MITVTSPALGSHKINQILIPGISKLQRRMSLGNDTGRYGLHRSYMSSEIINQQQCQQGDGDGSPPPVYPLQQQTNRYKQGRIKRQNITPGWVRTKAGPKVEERPTKHLSSQ
jgi:hypothetical protein